MSNETGPQVPNTEDLFIDALEIKPADRPAFLDSTCGDNLELRRELDSLLSIADSRPELLVPPDIGLIPPTLGRYEILSECGRGGMGIVFEATDNQLLRTVALKVLPQYLSRKKKNISRLTQEAQTLAGLNHANIATLYSLAESDGFHFLTMEFVKGVTLAEVLAHRLLSWQETLSLGLQVVGALEAAHAMGICHCDLKPDNIMVSPEGKATLLDFGISRAFQHLMGKPYPNAAFVPGFSLPMGTPNYMAPEQSTGRPVDERTDLWALAAVLFECLTGQGFSQVMVTGDRDWDGVLPENTPKKLARLLQSCLAEDPEKRLQSATTVRKEIEGLLPEAKYTQWILGTAGGILLVGALVWYLMFGRGPNGPLQRLEMPHPSLVEGLNQRGELLWSRPFDIPIRQTLVLRETSKAASPDVVGPVVGCVVTLTREGGGSLLNFLDTDTGGSLWTHEPAWVLPVNAIGPIQYRWTASIGWPGQNQPVILNGIRDGMWYGFAVEALDLSGETLGVYHHPGPLRVSRHDQNSGNPGQDLLLYGLNSSARFNQKLVPFETVHHPGCVVLLHPKEIFGQAFPYSENLPETRDWPHLPKARESAYLLVPMISPELDSRVDQVQIHDSETIQPGYSAVIADGRFIILDHRLFPLKCVIGRDTAASDLYLAGEAIFPPYLHIQDGKQEWVEVPIEH